MSRPMYQVHIADGFADDCDELIHRCSKMPILTYQIFCDIWKDLKFGYIYSGRTLGAEIAELSEEVIHIAKRYMVANTCNFEEQVAGLFLIYGLIHLQPFTGFASLRLIPEDVPAINRIEMVARRERRLDILYILGSLLINGHCQFHADIRERGMEGSLRKYLEGYTSIDRLGVRPKGVFYRQNEELDTIRDLGNLSRLYQDAKSQVRDSSGVMDRSLMYMDSELPKELDTSLKKLINGMIDPDPDNDGRSEDDDVDVVVKRPRNIQDIKKAAFTSAVDPVNHLIGVQQKKETASKNKISPPKQKGGKAKGRRGIKAAPALKTAKSKESTTNGIKTPELSPENIEPSTSTKTVTCDKTTKIRTSSPKKPVTTQTVKTYKRKRKNRKSKKESDESDDNDGVDEALRFQEDASQDLNIEEFHKVKPGTGISAENDILDIIHIAPVLIRTDQSESMEIELLDQSDETDEKSDEITEIPITEASTTEGSITESTIIESTTTKSTKTIKTTPRKNTRSNTKVIFKELPDVSIKKLRKSVARRNCKKKNDTEEMAVVSKVPEPPVDVRLKKVDKRHLKNTHLRSKFKRLGMLPVTSFKDCNEQLP